MAKNITVPVEYGFPTVTVWVNDQRYDVETGKKVSVDDAVYLILEKMMEKPAVPESTSSENYRIKFTKSGSTVTCNKSYAEVWAMATSGANLIAEYDDGASIVSIMHLAGFETYSNSVMFTSLWTIPGLTDNQATYISYSKSGCTLTSKVLSAM